MLKTVIKLRIKLGYFAQFIWNTSSNWIHWLREIIGWSLQGCWPTYHFNVWHLTFFTLEKDENLYVFSLQINRFSYKKSGSFCQSCSKGLLKYKPSAYLYERNSWYHWMHFSTCLHQRMKLIPASFSHGFSYAPHANSQAEVSRTFMQYEPVVHSPVNLLLNNRC